MKLFLLISLFLFSNAFYKSSRTFVGSRLFSQNNYPFSRKYYENYIKRLNSKNITIQNQEILGNNDIYNHSYTEERKPKLRIIINQSPFPSFEQEDDPDFDEPHSRIYLPFHSNKKIKSDHFEIIQNSTFTFENVGGYDSVKRELEQCIDLLKNHSKYEKFNVRVPKGLILEGPPGNGKTLLAKALSGEAKCNFISVSGSEFQEKYVGVGASKIRELFNLAKNNKPCIIFFDEIDAVGRSRSSDGETASSERDNTLNQLLVALDGFHNSSGVFVVGATNRADLLDNALLRPGRFDKRIFIGNPDKNTRREIIEIHEKGKPRIDEITIEDLIDTTSGFSGAQIENLLNEAMLLALRDNREIFDKDDLECVLNRFFVGWQPNEHSFTNNIIDRIVIHEMGHAVVGMFSKHHANVSKVIINLSAPSSPGYTLFENHNSNIYTRDALFEHLMILLSGRIAEEEFFGLSVTTGAINDFEEALKLANKMVLHYGMGQNIIYPYDSEKYKEKIDNDIMELIEDAYKCAKIIVSHSRDFIQETAELLKENNIIRIEELQFIMDQKYPHIKDLGY